MTDIKSATRPIRRPPEPTVQVNVRLSPATRDLIAEISDRDGLTIREVVEQAIEANWGSGRTPLAVAS